MTHYAEYFEMLMAFDLLQDKSFVQLELSFSHQVLEAWWNCSVHWEILNGKISLSLPPAPCYIQGH